MNEPSDPDPGAGAAHGRLAALLGPAGEPDPVSERIVDAALALFRTFGLRRTTIEDVARRAGLGRATVYRRFESKDNLVAAVLRVQTRRTLAEIEAAMAGVEPADRRLVEGFVAGLRAVREHPLFGPLLEIEPEFALPYLTVQAGELIALARQFAAGHIRRAQDEGTVAAQLDPEMAAEVVVRLAHSILLAPEGVIPTGEDALRAFAADYVVAPLTSAANPHRAPGR